MRLALELYFEEKLSDFYNHDSEDCCDYCGVPVILGSMNGHDIFLDGWERSLCCVDCAEQYQLVKFWLLDKDLKEIKVKTEWNIEQIVYKMVDYSNKIEK